MSRPKPTIIYENTVPASFVRRIDRCTAKVLVDGNSEIVQLNHTGRLEELLRPKAKVMLQKTDDPNRETAYDLISVYKTKQKWVNIDGMAPIALMKQELEQYYGLVKPAFTYGNLHADFYMERDGEKYLTVVKGCTLTPDQYHGIGFFPDAPAEHVMEELQALAEAVKQGYICTIAFVSTMTGIRLVLPNDKAQPGFGQAMRNAAKAGLQVFCYGCHVEADRIWITSRLVDTARYLH